MSTIEQWVATWRALGVEESPGLRRVHDDVLARYAEPNRHYHTVQHLTECFARLSEIRELAEHPGEVELALWFHDAIYDVRRSDNEDKSAAWARDAAVTAGVASEIAQRVHALVMFTRHAAVPTGVDAKVLVDVDLSILGADDARFDEYELQVRKEYEWVPGFLFRRNRKKVLREFLARPRIFSTTPFMKRYEQQARSNIRRSLEKLA